MIDFVTDGWGNRCLLLLSGFAVLFVKVMKFLDIIRMWELLKAHEDEIHRLTTFRPDSRCG